MSEVVESSEKDDSAGTIVKEKLKTELPPSLQKICGVCGDKALGYNFNAISCESCKAFFRRNALASKEFKCPFSNSCQITAVTRRFCQKCRLEKCLSIGMVKEFIMSDEDKAEKRKKIEENRAKKRTHRDSCDEPVTSSKHVKREDEVIHSTASPEEFASPRVVEPAIIQYDVLNSTTSNSPGSVSSPAVSSEVDSPSQPSPIYTQYVNVTSQSPDYHNQYQTYAQRKFTIHPNHYEQSVPEHYTVRYETVQPSGNNTIRSILTSNGETIYDGAKPNAHVCNDIPSTSSHNINKARDILEDVERIPIEPNSMESILCEAIKLEFEAYSSVSQCNSSSRQLNEVERAKLNELIVANKALHAPIDADVALLIEGASAFKHGMSVDGHYPELLTIINLTAIAIRRIIKMAKKINAFKNMCEEDQVALLKGGCTEIMVLRSTMTYDVQRNSWEIPHSSVELASIKTDVLKLAKGNIYQAHESFIRTFDPRWRTDEHIILIMSAILLFTPDRPKVVHTDVIKLEQNSYYYLLRRYLESVYPGCEAKSIFLKLIQKIMELHKLSDEIISVYLDVNPIEPLLMEIFDLKQHAA